VYVFLNYKLIGNHFLRRSLVISFFCFAGVFHLQAQPRYSRFSHLTVEDGLSSNRIRCIYRDSKDYLWIGTEEGLDKYNSYDIFQPSKIRIFFGKSIEVAELNDKKDMFLALSLIFAIILVCIRVWSRAWSRSVTSTSLRSREAVGVE